MKKPSDDDGGKPVDPNITDLVSANEWINAQVAKAMKQKFSGEFLVGRLLGEAALARNPDNRPIRDWAIRKMTIDMVESHWPPNGESMKFDRSGLLNDGQHRCLAIIRADMEVPGILVPMWITFGLSRMSRMTLDRPVIRTAADYAHFNGMNTDGRLLTAAAGLVIQHADRGYFSPTNVNLRASAVRVVEYLSENQRTFARCAEFIPSRNTPIAGGRALLIACAYVFSQVAPFQEVINFLVQLKDGANLPANSPIMYARNRMVTTKLNMRTKGELIFRTWNAHRLGETPNTITLMRGKYPDVEG